jgi:hypothetical protein
MKLQLYKAFLEILLMNISQTLKKRVCWNGQADGKKDHGKSLKFNLIAKWQDFKEKYLNES